MSSHLCKQLTSYSCFSKKKPEVRGDITEEALAETYFGKLVAEKRICLQGIYTTFYLLLYNKFWDTNYVWSFFSIFNKFKAGSQHCENRHHFSHQPGQPVLFTYNPVLFETFFQEAKTGTKRELTSFPSQPENPTGESKRLFNNRSFVPQ